MARMHSRKRGKHGSKKPAKKTAPSWILHDSKKAELLIAKLSKEGKTASQIGIILRDVYGIPNILALCGKPISAILKEKKLSPEIPEDLTSLFKKYAGVKKHLEINRHDEAASRGLLLTQSKINRLVKYYKRSGRIPETWKFDAERMGFFAE
ncbi:30S ribosomal protein S15 [Candidatus Woesearchaeota archaeon]|nr:30S ribosomal protein S15 [Candidatus Woesearchaeota archaeon]